MDYISSPKSKLSIELTISFFYTVVVKLLRIESINLYCKSSLSRKELHLNLNQEYLNTTQY
jgi:hypothetical protein